MGDVWRLGADVLENQRGEQVAEDNGDMRQCAVRDTPLRVICRDPVGEIGRCAGVRQNFVAIYAKELARRIGA